MTGVNAFSSLSNKEMAQCKYGLFRISTGRKPTLQGVLNACRINDNTYISNYSVLEFSITYFSNKAYEPKKKPSKGRQ
jgi:hypothetical protein